jgi:hypothetical protein
MKKDPRVYLAHIDNQTHRLGDILSSLLAEHKGRSPDVATAYFTVIVKDNVPQAACDRLAKDRKMSHDKKK